MDREKKQLTVFGYGLAIILGLIAIHLWRRHGWHVVHVILLPGMIAFVYLTATQNRLLTPLYNYWMKVARFIGTVLTGVILSLLFYLVFGIAGLILRVMGKDLLDQRIERSKGSYWRNTDQVDFDKSNYTRQF